MPPVDAQLISDLSTFLHASPSPFHAVAELQNRLVAAGFAVVDATQPWPTAPGDHVMVGDGSLVAWRSHADHAADAGFHIVGAHTDSPNLRLKPQPDRKAAGFLQVGVEVYGGVLLNSWLDRDLGVSGRLVTADGLAHLVRDDELTLRVPQLAIHLDRQINEEGLKLNRQQHMAPVWGLANDGADDFVAEVASRASVDPDAVRAFDLMLHDLEPPRRLGRDQELLAAPRIDNLVSCFAAVEALVAADPGDRIPVVALFDHEEVGSTTATGAASPVLADALDRIVAAGEGDRDAWARARARSMMVSADGAHATHPNYADRHEPDHHIRLDGGPTVKRNANARYATDAPGEARFIDICRQRDIPYQQFVNRTDLACGSTIGPISAAALGIRTVDVGIAQLSMHSIRELCGTRDVAWFRDALAGFFSAD